MRLLLLSTVCLLPLEAHAQRVADTTFSWQGYARTSIAHIQIFENPADPDRPHTVVVQEIAANIGPSTIDDVSYLAEQIGRTFALDPTLAYWVLHWGDFSFQEAKASRKELFLRATFKRNRSGQLGSPQWRVINREAVEILTDRAFY